MATASPVDLYSRALQAEALGRFDEARALHRSAAQADPTRLDIRLRLAHVCIRGGPTHYAEAESLLQAAICAGEQQGAPRQLAAALHLLALLCRRQGRSAEALRLLESSPVTRQTTAPGPELGQWLHYRGLLQADAGEFSQAERLYFRAFEHYREINHEPGLAEVCDSLANLLLRRGKSRAALRFAQLALDLKRRAGDRYGEAIALGTLGRIHLQQARYAEARTAFAGDLAIARDLDDQAGVGIALNSLAEAALLDKDMPAALAAFQESRSGARGPINAMHAEAGLARLHLMVNDLGAAMEACDRLADLLAATPSVRGLPHLLIGLRGAVAVRRGDANAGERLLRDAIDALQRQNFASNTIPFLYELRDHYQKQGATARAVEVMAQALDLWSVAGAERGVRDVEEWLRVVDSPGLTRLALERHFPSHLVQDIVQGRLAATEPHVQQVTVLFSDLRDYTALSENTAPTELVELLNEWFTEATLAVQRHGGTVDKFIGDAVMALFGVPEERTDAPAAATRAAIDMRDALMALNLRQKVLGGPTLRIGIGIDTGEALVGFIGSHLRQSYTAIGTVVNTASRLEGKTKDYPGCDILISQAVEDGQRKLGVAETAFLGQTKVKGLQQEIAVYHVLGLRQSAPG